MDTKLEFLRYASPNEQRTISREDLGYYHAVVIGATYEFTDGLVLDSPSPLFRPLAHCIREHPFLSVLVADRHTNKAYYQRAPVVNLEEHIEILSQYTSADTKGWHAIEEVLKSNLDRPFPLTKPPWRVIVLPLDGPQYFIAFAYSHMIGDGPTGFSFHRSLLEAVRTPSTVEQLETPIVAPSLQPLPPPFDTPQRLSISWSFLLGPLIAVLVPSFVANWLGVKPQIAEVDDETWAGSPACFDPSHPEASRSKVVVRLVEARLVEKAVQESRRHGAKLTGTLHQFIVRALSRIVVGSQTTKLISQTSINMRRSVGVPVHEMGEFVSATYVTHPKSSSSGPLSPDEWAIASSSTKRFAKAAVTLQDQPIGLLRYVPNMKKWLSGKIGQRRDCSYEVSNIGVFVDEHPESSSKARIQQVVFAQPGHVSSAPICFNFSTMQGGSMVYTVTWPTGALGVAETEEENLIDAVCKSIQIDFEELV
ncbi:l-amino acid oxidase [Colletotrichum incanum]|uniref:L-amino acid oxidase n=1 Tax=Colletotrichum incanum TaxID=1573173 RepID=A0A162PIY8_COLIC|nr:l-amino acid oxidase [Colletotrichum incanum]